MIKSSKPIQRFLMSFLIFIFSWYSRYKKTINKKIGIIKNDVGYAYRDNANINNDADRKRLSSSDNINKKIAIKKNGGNIFASIAILDIIICHGLIASRKRDNIATDLLDNLFARR